MLAAILGFADLLVESFEPDDPRVPGGQQISLAANRSAGLTRQLLAFARREIIQPRPPDINTVIRHAQALLPSVLGGNVELELRLAPDLGVVNADARQIDRDSTRAGGCAPARGRQRDGAGGGGRGAGARPGGPGAQELRLRRNLDGWGRRRVDPE